MTTGIDFLDRLDEVRIALNVVAPSFEGRKNLERHDVPNRYVWVYTGIGSQAPQGVGGTGARSISTDVFSMDVHCWGSTLAHALKLRQALATALRLVIGGRITNTDLIGDDAHTTNGYAAVVRVDLQEQLIEADLTKCGACVRDADFGVTARATAVNFKPPVGTQGDGKLEQGEG